MNLKQDLKLLAAIESLIGTMMIIPTLLAKKYGEPEALRAFLISLAVIFSLSAFLYLVCRNNKKNHMSMRDGMLFVTLTWVTSAAMAALPLVLSGAYPTYTDAYFEMMSGFTTTGATVLSAIEPLPKSVLFWRSQTNWLGGMGIVVLFVAFLPVLGVRGTMLFASESVGPTKDKLTPKIEHTAGILWSIYVGFSLLEVLFLLAGNLDLYEAVTVTFSTMAAAGFCVKNSSIGTFNSAYVDVVVTVFMMASGANFALYYKLLKRKQGEVFRDKELRCYLAIFASVTLLSAVCMSVHHTYQSFATSLRYSAFQAASIITTTGFATADYLNWPMFSQMLLFLLFFVGGCAGSAGGGIKVVRVRTLFSLAKNTITRRIHPNAIACPKVNGAISNYETVNAIAGFVAIYIGTGIIATVIVSLSGADFTTCIASVFLTLGNIGIGFGKVGPTGNFGFFPLWAKWVFSFLMLVGRLELFTVYSLFTRDFWR